YEAVAPATHGLNHRFRCWRGRASGQHHGAGECSRRDLGASPRPPLQLLPSDDAVSMVNQMQQNVERDALDRAPLASMPELEPLLVRLEIPETKCCQNCAPRGCVTLESAQRSQVSVAEPSSAASF